MPIQKKIANLLKQIVIVEAVLLESRKGGGARLRVTEKARRRARGWLLHCSWEGRNRTRANKIISDRLDDFRFHTRLKARTGVPQVSIIGHNSERIINHLNAFAHCCNRVSQSRCRRGLPACLPAPSIHSTRSAGSKLLSNAQHRQNRGEREEL